MRTLLGLLIGLLLAIPMTYLGWKMGYLLAEDHFDYETEHMQIRLNDFEMRDKFEGLRHIASNGKLGPQTEPK